MEIERTNMRGGGTLQCICWNEMESHTTAKPDVALWQVSILDDYDFYDYCTPNIVYAM